MTFDNVKEQQIYLDAFGIMTRDEIMVTEGEFTGKIGEVIHVRLDSGSPMYNVSFHDGTQIDENKRFSRRSLQLVNK